MAPAPHIPNQPQSPEGGTTVLPGQTLLMQDVGLGDGAELATLPLGKLGKPLVSQGQLGSPRMEQRLGGGARTPDILS